LELGTHNLEQNRSFKILFQVLSYKFQDFLWITWDLTRFLRGLEWECKGDDKNKTKRIKHRFGKLFLIREENYIFGY